MATAKQRERWSSERQATYGYWQSRQNSFLHRFAVRWKRSRICIICGDGPTANQHQHSTASA